MKPVRLTRHASEQACERGVSEEEIRITIEIGEREPTKKDRWICRYNFAFDSIWRDKNYAIKQVVPVIKEEENEIVVITVYSFYF